MPLLLAELMTSRNLTLTLRQHLPIFLKRGSFAKMLRQDNKRNINKLTPVDKDELIVIVQNEEKRILKFEANMRAAI